MSSPWFRRPHVVQGIMEPVKFHAGAGALRTRPLSPRCYVASASSGLRLRACSALAARVTCTRDTSKAKASYATNATGRCRNAVKRTVPRKKLAESRKETETRQNPHKPSGCRGANVCTCVRLRRTLQIIPRACLRAGGNAACDRSMMVIIGAISAGSRI